MGICIAVIGIVLLTHMRLWTVLILSIGAGICYFAWRYVKAQNDRKSS